MTNKKSQAFLPGSISHIGFNFRGSLVARLVVVFPVACVCPACIVAIGVVAWQVFAAEAVVPVPVTLLVVHDTGTVGTTDQVPAWWATRIVPDLVVNNGDGVGCGLKVCLLSCRIQNGANAQYKYDDKSVF